MKAKYIFTSLMMSFMAITDMNAQNNLVVVKNDGSQQTFTLTKKPYMLFTDDNIQIVTHDNQADISYLDFNYFSYQGQQQSRMNAIVETTGGMTLHELENDQRVMLGYASKDIVTNSYSMELDEKGIPAFTKNCNIMAKHLNEDDPYYNRLPFNSYLDVEPTSSASQAYIAFTVPPIGSGTYDLYLVTLPLKFTDIVSEEEASKPYQFRVNMFYRTKDGGWPKIRNEVLKNPADPTGKEQNYNSSPTGVDTIFLGTKTFDADITQSPSIMVQVQSYVPTSETKNYSRRMCINGLMMKAHNEDFSATKFLKFSETTWYSPNDLQRISCIDQLTFTSEMVSNDILSPQLKVNLNGTPYYADVDFYGTMLTIDENGIISIPYILFPGYDYQYTPSLFVEGTPSTIRIKDDTSGLLATSATVDNADVHVSAQLLGMKTFWTQYVKGKHLNDIPCYRVGIELKNMKTDKVFSYYDPKEILTRPDQTPNSLTITDNMEYAVDYKIYELGFGQTYQCRAFLEYGNSTNIYRMLENSPRCYDSHPVEITTPTREEYEKLLKKENLPQIMANDASISLFNQAMAATHMGERLEKYIDETYSLSADSVNQWFYYSTGAEYDIVGYMQTRYFGYTGFVEPNEVFAQHGIKTLDDLRNYAKQVYDEMYPEDAGVKDETDSRNSLNRFVAYHFLPERIEYDKLTADNILLRTFDRKHWDVAEWYETMMPYSIMKVSYPSGSSEGRYVNRRGVMDRPDWRGVFVAGAKIKSPSKADKELVAINGVYHYIDDIIDYGRNTQEVVLNERMRIDATTLSPDFMTSGARGHAVVGVGGVSSYPGQYGRQSSSPDPDMNPNHCFGFKRGAATNFAFTPNTHLHVRNRNLCFWSYQGDEVLISGRFDVTVKIPPVPAGVYELRIATLLGFPNRGIVAFYLDGKPCGLPIDLRKDGYDPSVGFRSDSDLGDDEAVAAYDKALHNRGWMKGPASYGNINQDGTGSPFWMRNGANEMRRVLTTFISDGATDHYLRIQQLLNMSSSAFAFDYIELCPRSVYDNDLYPEDKW